MIAGVLVSSSIDLDGVAGTGGIDRILNLVKVRVLVVESVIDMVCICQRQVSQGDGEGDGQQRLSKTTEKLKAMDLKTVNGEIACCISFWMECHLLCSFRSI